VPGLGHDDMAAALAHNLPAELRKRPHDVARPQKRNLRHSDDNFDFLRLHGWGQTFLGTNCQALANSSGDIRFRLGKGLALADTAGNRRTIGYVDSVLILKNIHSELPPHAMRLSSSWPFSDQAHRILHRRADLQELVFRIRRGQNL